MKAIEATGNHEGVLAFVLAGGRSSRMGTDKAFLELRGQSLLSHALDLARSVTADVRIVGDPAKFGAFGTVVADIYPGQGPLAGIHAALSSSGAELNLVLAVDLPVVEGQFLKYLVEQARQSSAVATLAHTKDGWQPLCAVYRKEFASHAEAALREGKNRIDLIFPSTSVRELDEEELARNGFAPSMFRNINTPEDWEEMKSRR